MKAFDLLGRLCGPRQEALSSVLEWYWQERVLHRRSRRADYWDVLAKKREKVHFVLQPGVRIQLYHDCQLSRRIFTTAYEWQERCFVSTFLRKGDTFVDVGANIGLYALIAAHRVGKTGRVFAFEPCSRTYERLLSNVNLNGATKVSCYRTALSNSAGQLEMAVSLDGFDAWNSLAQPVAGGAFEHETVETTTWDSFAEEHDLRGRVTMMKIDVEGWEPFVLSGARETLSREDAPILLVEFTEEVSSAAGSSCIALYDAIRALGYELLAYDGNANRIVPSPRSQTYDHVNLIAAKEPEVIASRLEGLDNRYSARWARD